MYGDRNSHVCLVEMKSKTECVRFLFIVLIGMFFWGWHDGMDPSRIVHGAFDIKLKLLTDDNCGRLHLDLNWNSELYTSINLKTTGFEWQSGWITAADYEYVMAELTDRVANSARPSLEVFLPIHRMHSTLSWCYLTRTRRHWLAISILRSRWCKFFVVWLVVDPQLPIRLRYRPDVTLRETHVFFDDPCP